MNFKEFYESHLIGDCRNENLVDEIFGSVSEFARQVELHGDNFIYGNIKVVYNPKTDIHYFKTLTESWKQPGKVLYIMRGISGSGKSTLAHEIQAREGGVIYSTDEFRYINRKYVFDEEKNVAQHAANIHRAEAAIRRGISPILIDNVNVKFHDAKPYIKEALKYGYEIRVIEPKTEWAFNAKELAKRNEGRAPYPVVKQMIKDWQPHEEFLEAIKNLKNGRKT